MPADRLRATPPDQVWALDDVTADGRILKLLNIVDEHTREALEIVVDRRIDADRTVATLDRIVAGRGTAPQFIRCDNGPELTANALRDWCRFTGAASSYIEPGSPWENPYVESFGSRLRDELLTCEHFNTLLEAKSSSATGGLQPQRPHSSLGWKPPAVYAASLNGDPPTRLSQKMDQQTGSGHDDHFVAVGSDHTSDRHFGWSPESLN